MAEQVVVITTTENSPDIIHVDDTVVVTVPAEEPAQIVTEGIQGPAGGQGPQGIQGPPGLSGAGYVYVQNEAATIWDIGHALDRFPSVTIVDFDGYEVEADIRYVDSDNIRVTTTQPLAGVAYLN